MNQFPGSVWIYITCNTLLHDYIGFSLAWRREYIPYLFIFYKDTSGWWKKGSRMSTWYLVNLTFQTPSPSWEVNNLINHLRAQTMCSKEPLFLVLFCLPFINTQIGLFSLDHLQSKGKSRWGRMKPFQHVWVVYAGTGGTRQCSSLWASKSQYLNISSM